MEKAGNKILEKNKLNQPKRRLFDDFKRVILAIRVLYKGFNVVSAQFPAKKSGSFYSSLV